MDVVINVPTVQVQAFTQTARETPHVTGNVATATVQVKAKPPAVQ